MTALLRTVMAPALDAASPPVHVSRQTGQHFRKYATTSSATSVS